MKSDRYRKGVPPAFHDSQPKYLQDELTKLERVLDLNYDDVKQVTQDGATLKASFDQEVTLRVDGDAALSQQITTLSATVDTDRANTAAAITAEQTARATQDTALAQQITNLSATVTSNNNTITSRVSTEESARATADTALSTRIDTLTSTVNTNNSTITSRVATEESARATADGALSTQIDNLTATVNSNTAAITTEQTARADGDTANANSISSLTTTVNGHTTTITQHTSSINGLTAKWGVKVNNNNRVAGIMLNSDSTGTSSFDIEANYVNVYEPGTNNKKLYWDGSSLVVRGDILATSITTSSVNNLGNYAISRPVVGAPTLLTAGTYGTSQSAGYYQYQDSGGVWQSGYRGFVVYIDTGIDVSGSWSTASTDQYLATATISAGTSSNGGYNGYGRAEVVIGDGLLTGGTNNPIDNRIYIRYEFVPLLTSGTGSITVTSISWKLARI